MGQICFIFGEIFLKHKLLVHAMGSFKCFKGLVPFFVSTLSPEIVTLPLVLKKATLHSH